MISTTFLVVALLAGVLTVLAPCILPLLPVVLGVSAAGRSRATPYIVVASLSVSIFIFTYALKASTVFITIPPYVWTYISGGIVVLFGCTLLFPSVWERLPGLSKATVTSHALLGKGHQKKSVGGDILIGAALGPVFSTCSPTYFVILAQVLPERFFVGTVYLLAYITGLAVVLLLIALLGERFAYRLTGLSNPRGKFKKVLGGVFIGIGVFIILGFDKKIETFVLDTGYLDITRIEQRLLDRVEE